MYQSSKSVLACVAKSSQHVSRSGLECVALSKSGVECVTKTFVKCFCRELFSRLFPFSHSWKSHSDGVSSTLLLVACCDGVSSTLLLVVCCWVLRVCEVFIS